MQSSKMSRTFVLSSLLLTGLLGISADKAFAASGTFAFTGSLNTARYDHTATLLANGEVLVTGGWALILQFSPAPRYITQLRAGGPSPAACP
jgi:hypothetical protein